MSDASDKSDQSDRSDRSDPFCLATAAPEVAANTLLCLTHQATYLLRWELETLGREFLHEGGFTERLFRERQKRRSEEEAR